MTNETNYRTKANAVFFAAIMVVSMVQSALRPLLRLPSLLTTKWRLIMWFPMAMQQSSRGTAPEM